MRKSKTSNGFISILEKIIRSHPAIYLVIRNLIKYTNIFEKDFDGLKYLNFEKTKLNIIDVGASDGIASKFFNKNLNTGTIYCYEPSKYYQEILKKNKIKNIIIKPYAIGNMDIKKKVFFPRYKFLNKKYDIISYTHYDLNLMNHFFRDFKFRKNLSIVSDTLAIKKVGEFKKKIHLIKIDTNGYELAIIKGLIKTIKKDLPVILTEVNKDENNINRILKDLSYEGYFYSVAKNKFTKKAETDSLNKYFLQKKHLNNKFSKL